MMSVIAAIASSVQRNPAKVAIACNRQSWTYAEFNRLTDNIGRNILAAGGEPGDRVALHLQNGPELAMGYIGCLKAGCILVPINTRLKGREIDYMLRHSGSAFYVGQPDLYDEIVDTCPALSELHGCYLTEEATGGISSFADLLKTPSRNGGPSAITQHHLASILYTSGTTALPKGVVHTLESLGQTAVAMRHMNLDEDQVVLIMSSMAHMVGFAMLFLAALQNGATTVITRPFDFQSSLDSIAEWKCTYLLGLPVMLKLLLDAKCSAPRDVSSCRHCYCGGDSVTPALQEAFQQSFPPVCEVYGATEIAPMSWNQPGDIRVGSIGRPGGGVELRLADSCGVDIAPGQVGEVQVRGPHLMKGYWQNADATSAAFDRGWFRTGDLGRQDADGYFWFAGRKKEIIVRGGSNISPQEVEAVLHEHPCVAEAGVVGCPDPVWGETVVAHVVLQIGQRLDAAELIAFARERLAEYKLPETVVFRSDLPKGPTGKLQRNALREDQQAPAARVAAV
jgi:long-chain acyl-CoA synthetase